MRKNLETTDKDYSLMDDYNRLYQAVYIPEENEEYWNTVDKFIKAFLKKYSNNKFAEDLCMSLVDELNRRAKK